MQINYKNNLILDFKFGITFQHIDNTAAKLKTPNNITHKLAGLTGGQQYPH